MLGSRAMAPEEYNKIVNQHFKQYCNIDLGVAGWWQSFTALAYEHLANENPDKLEPLQSQTTITNDQMGHSNMTSAVHYSNRRDEPIGVQVTLQQLHPSAKSGKCSSWETLLL